MEIRYSYKDVPTIREFSECDAFIRGVLGPFGSGKSSGCVVEIINRSMAQAPGPDGIRRTRWAVIRNSYAQLSDTSIRTFHQWVPPKYFGEYTKNDHIYHITNLDGADIEVLFRALDRPDQVDNLLSLELTGAWVNEAREVPWTIIQALQGRVGRYPAAADGGATWYGVIADTNPPDVDSWWYKLFEEKRPVNAKIFKQPGGMDPKAENLKNLPPNYYQNLLTTMDEEAANVYVHGKYGFVRDGKPVFPEYSDTFHCSEKATPVPDLPIYRGWDFGLCYDDKTEVLTEAGWKFFKDVDVDSDLIATRNPITKNMEYAKAAFKIDKPYNGELLEWSSTEVNFCVTPEHRVPFTFRDTPEKVHFASAQWLSEHHGGHHYVDLTSIWNPKEGWEDEIFFGLGAHEWAEFMGLYLSEGSTDKKRVTIYQANRDPDMQRILDATGWKWVWKNNGKSGGWRAWIPQVAKYLSEIGTAKEKRVPVEIRRMGVSAIEKFIMSYSAGDGHIRRRPNGSMEHVLFTASLEMANDMQELAQKVGWYSSLAIVAPSESVITEGNTQRVIVNGGGYCVRFKKSAIRAELHSRNFKKIPYVGRVYCLNVPYHTLYVRRNGRPHWNGNTPACAFSQFLPIGQWRIIDEMIAESMGANRFSDDVLSYCSQVYPDYQFIDIGDPAGMSRSESDERTCFEILHGKGIQVEPGNQSLTMRLECVKFPLNSLISGVPAFLIHPQCKVLRKGYQGRYQFRRMQTSQERYIDKPDKNSYSHIQDANQYVATRLFGHMITQPNFHEDDDEDDRRRYGRMTGRSAISGY